jgi:hypothetical protein
MTLYMVMGVVIEGVRAKPVGNNRGKIGQPLHGLREVGKSQG